LPYCYINGLHKELEFTGHDNLIGPWIKVPSHKEHLLFYHGEKNIEKIKEFINETYNQEETLEEWKSKFTHHCAIKKNNL
jgi:hypothetical protein